MEGNGPAEPGKLTGKIKGFVVGEGEGRGEGGGQSPGLSCCAWTLGESFGHHQVAVSVDLGLKPCLPSHYPCGLEVSLEIHSIPTTWKQPLSLCRRTVKSE